jgi:tRNA(fMet)-specific endonuclease VapC
MSGYLLDTNHAGVLLGDSAALRTRVRAASADAFYLCQPSLGELWYMVFNSTRVDENRLQLAKLLAEFPTLEFDASCAMEFGKIQVALRKRGRPIPAIDVQIAAVARTQDLTVLTSDAHFDSVDALRVENWLT